MSLTPSERIGKAFWNLYARVYDTLLVFDPYLSMISGSVRSVGLVTGSKVLDAGCGTGNVSRALVVGGYQVTAVDASDSMLEATRKKCPELSTAKVDLNTPLPFRDASFDAVTCSNVLYTLKTPAATLAEFARILKPGGRVVLTNPVPHCSTSKIFQQHWLSASWRGRVKMLLSIPKIGLLFAFNLFLLTPERRASLYLPNGPDLQDVLCGAGFEGVSVEPCYAGQSWLVVGCLESR